MGVIGRLDKQVEDVLINPVRDRQKGTGEEAASPTPEGTPDEAREETTEERKREKPQSGNDELPVWLL